jgi:hypothetical protein
LLKGKDHQHRFFIAMAYWQLGDKEKARHYFDEGVAWFESNPFKPGHEKYSVRSEAEQLMGIGKQKSVSQESQATSQKDKKKRSLQPRRGDSQ